MNCGNNFIDTGEDCDGTEIGGLGCADLNLGYTGGTLSCDDSCNYDFALCEANHPDCGNGVLDDTEVCDGTNLDGNNCTTVGGDFTGGTLGCNNCVWDLSQCITSFCGDLVCDSTEDATSCPEDCGGIGNCGNGVIEGNEECDAPDFNGETCESRGFSGGFLQCGETCTIVESGCEYCGDGIVQSGEECDGTGIMADCASSNESLFYTGNVGCNSSCNWDTSSCRRSGFVSFALGFHSGCGLLEDGTVWCWGRNQNGQLGPDSVAGVDLSSAIQITGIDNVVEIDGGFSHFCALKSDNSVWCWGNNSNGQLGYGVNSNSSTPLEVAGLPNVSHIITGGNFSCGLKNDNTLWCWGDNSSGQLGTGNFTSSSTPIESMAGSFVQISGGSDFACGVTSTGEAYCWGNNDTGQLGSGDFAFTNSATPVLVTSQDSFSSVACGNTHACGVTTSGNIFCWGNNSNGRLGDQTTTASATPLQVIGVSGVLEAGPARNFTCARVQNREIWCWGYGDYGQLGDGNSISSATPVRVFGIDNAISLGNDSSYFACTLTDDGRIQCWGYEGYGRLGNGVDTDSVKQIPVPVNETWRDALCNNGIDDDGDGTVDCEDSDCNGLSYCGDENSEIRCSDQVDNDGDGNIDCNDPDCDSAANCGGEGNRISCSDNIDNDNDGFTDCEDSDCDSLCNTIFEVFDNTNSFDLTGIHITFTPDGQGSYNWTSAFATGFMETPGSGNATQMINMDEDAFSEIPLPFTFEFYGNSYNSLFLNSNGNITFNAGDSDYSPTVNEFLSGNPRISYSWLDLKSDINTPDDDIFLDTFPHYIVITHVDDWDYYHNTYINLQCIIHDNGVIEFFYLDCTNNNALVGITAGMGAPSVPQVNFKP